MLPAYNATWISSAFFISYLMIGLYFLLSLFLANIFTKHKNRLENTAKNRTDERRKYLEKYFDQYAKKVPGQMDLSEAKRFFGFVFDLDYHRKQDQETFIRIMKVIDPHSNNVSKENLIHYFSIPGFLNIARVE